jgi:hypothetical protein
MKRKYIKTKRLEKRLKQKKSYIAAFEVVKKFLEEEKKLPKPESIKIYPYAEYPWRTFSEMTSNRWLNTD